MNLESYLMFVFASFILCVVPGPDMILVMSRTISQGPKAGFWAAMGINIGGYVHLVAAVLGLSAILETSAMAFNILKYIGAGYLVFMGVQSFFSKQNTIAINKLEEQELDKWKVFWQGFLSDALNPKVAIFFLAFLPQFIDAQSEHRTMQIVLLGITVNVVGVLFNFIIIYFSGILSQVLQQNPKVNQWINKAVGGVFVLLGLRLANEKLT